MTSEELNTELDLLTGESINLERRGRAVNARLRELGMSDLDASKFWQTVCKLADLVEKEDERCPR